MTKFNMFVVSLQLEGAIPLIVLMGLSDSDVVVGQACQLIGMPAKA